MSRYLLIETLISIAINAAISAGFAVFVFAGQPEIGLWGPSGLALDFVPQSFMIALMSVIVPTALTRRRVDAGTLVARADKWPWLPRNLLLRALFAAVGSAVLLGGAATTLLAAAWTGPLGFPAVLALKISYGAFVALLVTPPALRAALSDRTTRERA